MLPLPGLSTPQRTALMILLGVLLLAAVALGGYLYGTGKAAEKAAERERTLLTQLNEANEKNREQEKAHDKRVADLRAEFARSNTEARERDARTVADLRAGNQRLRLQVTACSATPTDSPGGPPPELMEPKQPNLRQRLQRLSGPSPLTVTGPSGN